MLSTFFCLVIIASVASAVKPSANPDIALPVIPAHQKSQPIDCAQLLAASGSQSTAWTPVCNKTTNRLSHVQTLKTGQKFCVDLYTTGVLLGPTLTANDPISCRCATKEKMARLHRRQNATASTYTPQCDKVNGNFIATQCDTVAGQCWCVDNRGEQVGAKWSTTDAAPVPLVPLPARSRAARDLTATAQTDPTVCRPPKTTRIG